MILSHPKKPKESSEMISGHNDIICSFFKYNFPPLLEQSSSLLVVQICHTRSISDFPYPAQSCILLGFYMETAQKLGYPPSFSKGKSPPQAIFCHFWVIQKCYALQNWLSYKFVSQSDKFVSLAGSCSAWASLKLRDKKVLRIQFIWLSGRISGSDILPNIRLTGYLAGYPVTSQASGPDIQTIWYLVHPHLKK